MQVGPGTTLGMWKLLAPLATGGMAELFTAEHTRLKRLAAVKVMLPSIAQDTDMLARFELEATTLASVRHPHVVSVLDLGELDGGGLYLVLELIEGQNLRDLIKQGPLPRASALELTRQILLGLEDVHRLGVIHRDLKPSNILLRRLTDGSDLALIADFGIVRKHTNAEITESGLTSTGLLLGTPGYLAPEQILGESFDSKADLYAVGVILHEMLTGKRLFDGGSVEMLRKHLFEPAPLALPQNDPANAVLARALEKRPAQRFATAREMREALAAASSPLVSRPSAPAVAQATAPSAVTAGRAPTRLARPPAADALLEAWSSADPAARATLGQQLEARFAEALGQRDRDAFLKLFKQVRTANDPELLSVTRALLVERIGAALRLLGETSEVDALFSLLGTEAIERLVASLRSVDNPELALVVARGLLRLSARTVVDQLPGLKSVAVGAVVSETARLPFNDARPLLVLALNHVDKAAREVTLSRLPQAHALPMGSEVRKRLSDRDLEVRLAAIRLITELEDRLSLPALLAQASRVTGPERRAVLGALGVLGGAEAVNVLRAQFVNEKNLELRCAIAESLGKQGDRASLDLLRKESSRLLCPAALKDVCARYLK